MKEKIEEYQLDHKKEGDRKEGEEPETKDVSMFVNELRSVQKLVERTRDQIEADTDSASETTSTVPVPRDDDDAAA